MGIYYMEYDKLFPDNIQVIATSEIFKNQIQIL